MTSPAVFSEQWIKIILKAIISWGLISVLTIFSPNTKTFYFIVSDKTEMMFHIGCCFIFNFSIFTESQLKYDNVRWEKKSFPLSLKCFRHISYHHFTIFLGAKPSLLSVKANKSNYYTCPTSITNNWSPCLFNLVLFYVWCLQWIWQGINF